MEAGRYRCKHETPVEPFDMRLIGDLEEGKVRNVTQHDAKGSPHLPHHDKGATDGGRGTFSGINWYRGRLGTDAYSEEKASDEEMLP